MAATGAKERSSAIRSSAVPPPSTTTSHSSSQRSETSPCLTPTTTKGRLARTPSGCVARVLEPIVQVHLDSTGCVSSDRSRCAVRRAVLRRSEGSRIVRRYPADVNDPSGGALGEEWCHGADRAPRPLALTSGRPGRRGLTHWARSLPGLDGLALLPPACRPDGPVATRRHELRGELPGVAPARDHFLAVSLARDDDMEMVPAWLELQQLLHRPYVCAGGVTWKAVPRRDARHRRSTRPRLNGCNPAGDGPVARVGEEALS